MKTAIVTGANGFIGSALVNELIKSNYKIYAIDKGNCKNKIPKSEQITFIPCDLSNIRDLEKLITDRSIDSFFHLAWAGSAGAERADTELQMKNAQWSVDALRTAHNLNCKRFICAGSIIEHETMAACYEQGNRPGIGYIYGGGKLVAHVMCMSVAAQIGMDIVWAGITNAYGVGEMSPRLINTTIRKVIKGENPQFTAGTQNYDFVYIDDVVRAFRLISEKGKSFHEYLIGSSSAKPLKEFLLEMKNSLSPNIDFIFGDIPFTGIDLPLEAFDCSNTEKDTGFRAETSFADGVKKTYEWLKTLE